MFNQMITAVLVLTMVELVTSPTKFNCFFVKNTMTWECGNYNLTSIDLPKLNKHSAEVLNFWGNNLKSSEIEFFDYKFRLIVKEIRLNHNPIDSWPENLNSLPNLKIIDLRYNNISYIDVKSLRYFKYLEEVCLDGNPLNQTTLEHLMEKFPRIIFICETNYQKKESEDELTKNSTNSNDLVSTISNELFSDPSTYSTEEYEKTTESANIIGKNGQMTKSTTPIASSTYTKEEHEETTESGNIVGKNGQMTKSTTPKHSVSANSDILVSTSPKPIEEHETENNNFIIIPISIIAVCVIFVLAYYYREHIIPKIPSRRFRDYLYTLLPQKPMDA